MGRRRPSATCLFRRDRKGGKPTRAMPRVRFGMQTATITHLTERNQVWRKRKHKGEERSDDY